MLLPVNDPYNRGAGLHPPAISDGTKRAKKKELHLGKMALAGYTFDFFNIV
jgi:hypothetical protein